MPPTGKSKPKSKGDGLALFFPGGGAPLPVSREELRATKEGRAILDRTKGALERARGGAPPRDGGKRRNRPRGKDLKAKGKAGGAQGRGRGRPAAPPGGGPPLAAPADLRARLAREEARVQMATQPLGMSQDAGLLGLPSLGSPPGRGGAGPSPPVVPETPEEAMGRGWRAPPPDRAPPPAPGAPLALAARGDARFFEPQGMREHISTLRHRLPAASDPDAGPSWLEMLRPLDPSGAAPAPGLHYAVAPGPAPRATPRAARRAAPEIDYTPGGTALEARPAPRTPAPRAPAPAPPAPAPRTDDEEMALLDAAICRRAAPADGGRKRKGPPREAAPAAPAPPPADPAGVPDADIAEVAEALRRREALAGARGPRARDPAEPAAGKGKGRDGGRGGGKGKGRGEGGRAGAVEGGERGAAEAPLEVTCHGLRGVIRDTDGPSRWWRVECQCGACGRQGGRRVFTFVPWWCHAKKRKRGNRKDETIFADISVVPGTGPRALEGLTDLRSHGWTAREEGEGEEGGGAAGGAEAGAGGAERPRKRARGEGPGGAGEAGDAAPGPGPSAAAGDAAAGDAAAGDAAPGPGPSAAAGDAPPARGSDWDADREEALALQAAIDRRSRGGRGGADPVPVVATWSVGPHGIRMSRDPESLRALGLVPREDPSWAVHRALYDVDRRGYTPVLGEDMPNAGAVVLGEGGGARGGPAEWAFEDPVTKATVQARRGGDGVAVSVSGDADADGAGRGRRAARLHSTALNALELVERRGPRPSWGGPGMEERLAAGPGAAGAGPGGVPPAEGRSPAAGALAGRGARAASPGEGDGAADELAGVPATQLLEPPGTQPAEPPGTQPAPAPAAQPAPETPLHLTAEMMEGVGLPIFREALWARSDMRELREEVEATFRELNGRDVEAVDLYGLLRQSLGGFAIERASMLPVGGDGGESLVLTCRILEGIEGHTPRLIKLTDRVLKCRTGKGDLQTFLVDFLTSRISNVKRRA